MDLSVAAMGAYAAFRNPAHHLRGDWMPNDAFHHLAAFSQIANWIDRWGTTRFEADPANVANG